MFRPPTPRHRRLREERPWLLGWGPEGLGCPGLVIVTSWPACRCLCSASPFDEVTNQTVSHPREEGARLRGCFRGLTVGWWECAPRLRVQGSDRLSLGSALTKGQAQMDEESEAQSGGRRPHPGSPASGLTQATQGAGSCRPAERALSGRTASTRPTLPTLPQFKCAAPGRTPEVQRTGSGWEPGQVQGSGFELGHVSGVHGSQASPFPGLKHSLKATPACHRHDLPRALWGGREGPESGDARGSPRRAVDACVCRSTLWGPLAPSAGYSRECLSSSRGTPERGRPWAGEAEPVS